MKYDYYKKIEIAPDFETFDFISNGVRGVIHKRIFFELIHQPDIYNLAFGDLCDDGSIDDYSISDNKDMAKVLATIAAAINIFLNKYPNRKVFFRGSTVERTRLYRMAIGINYEELSANYHINGILQNGSLVNFEKNLHYDGFVISKKS
jgi:hypothetical protein